MNKPTFQSGLKELIARLASPSIISIYGEIGAFNTHLNAAFQDGITKCPPLTSQEMDDVTDRVKGIRRDPHGDVAQYIKVLLRDRGMEAEFLD